MRCGRRRSSAIGALLPTGVAGAAVAQQVALVQGNVPGVFLTWQRGEIFNLHVAETEQLVDRIEHGEVPQPDVVLWPENATDVDPFHDAARAARIEGLSATLGAPDPGRRHLRRPDGRHRLQRRRRLDAERPGGALRQAQGRALRRVRARSGSALGPSRAAVRPRHPARHAARRGPDGALRIGDFTVGDTICWDIAYDGLVRETVDGGAQMLVVQTSNASFTGTSQPEQQWKISRLRAIETGRWVLVPSTNGISGIVDAPGTSVARAPLHEPATLSADVPLADGSTPALRIGGWLELLLGPSVCWDGGAARAGDEEAHVMRALVVVPTYNEAENLDRWSSLACTPAAGRRRPRRRRRVTGRHRRDRRRARRRGRPRPRAAPAGQAGSGVAYRAGFAWGLERDYDCFVEMDADGSHRPDELGRLLNAARTAPTSSSAPAGSRAVGWSTGRGTAGSSRAPGRRTPRVMLGLPVHDATAGFRVLRRSTLERLDLDDIALAGLLLPDRHDAPRPRRRHADRRGAGDVRRTRARRSPR